MKDSIVTPSCTANSRSSRRASWADAASNGKLVEEQEPPDEPKSPLSMMLSCKSDAPRPVKPLVKQQSPLKSILKGAAGLAVAGETDVQVAPSATFEIQTRSRMVTCSPAEIVRKRFGLKISKR